MLLYLVNHKFIRWLTYLKKITTRSAMKRSGWTYRSFINIYLLKVTGQRTSLLKTVERSIMNSLRFGVYFQQRQIGFARIITDKATFAYLADVFFIEEHRGQGLAKWLVSIISWPSWVKRPKKIYVGNKGCTWLVQAIWVDSLTRTRAFHAASFSRCVQQSWFKLLTIFKGSFDKRPIFHLTFTR